MPDGGVEARGTIHTRDDAGITVLIADRAGTTAACADIDRDGNAGITFLQVVGHDPRSGAQTVVTFVPSTGEIGERGDHDVRIVLGNRIVPGVVTVLPIPAVPLDSGPNR